MHVGDHLTADLQGAVDAGLHAALIDRCHKYADLAGAEGYYLNDLGQLPDLLKSL